MALKFYNLNMNLYFSKECYNQDDKYYDFVLTQDGSTGLYNYQVDDIYHSVYGARTEAWEKFIKPLFFEKNFSNKKQLKVLDICYGIGYNTKALLKKLLLSNYKGAVQIDVLEHDKSLVLLSPFIKDGFFKKIPEVSYILLSNLMDYISQEHSGLYFNNLVTSSPNKKYIEPFYRDLIEKHQIFRYKCDPGRRNNAFLHNIYYHCISTRNKKPHKPFKISNYKIYPYFDDARNTVKSLNHQYDIVFLDAFTPSKLPTLWSLDFFKELYRITCDNCIVVTYSNSSAVRHAVCEAGFSAGKLFDKNKRPCGTIASKNIDYIEHKLDDYDIGLMNTSAGVYYLDKNLDSTCEEILFEHEERKRILNLESSSQYIKRFKHNKEAALNV